MKPLIELKYREPLTGREASEALESILQTAVQQHAEAIYLQSSRSVVVLKFRKDGEMQRIHHFSVESRDAIIAALNRLLEHQPPPDEAEEGQYDVPWGRMTRTILGKTVDFRVTFLPCELGRDIAIHINYAEDSAHNLQEILLREEDYKAVLGELRRPYGLHLVAGPPDSRKRETVWAMLQELNPETSNLVTIESPVRFLMPGVAQVEVQYEGAPDYCDALNTLRYHQPDAIYVDTIEDEMVLSDILRSVNQGQRVIATLPTTDIAETLAHLREMRESSRILFRAVHLVICQRTLARLHRDSAKRLPISKAPSGLQAELKARKVRHFWEPVPTEQHPSGFDGTITIQEVLVLDEPFRTFLKKNPSEEEIRAELAGRPGFRSLRQAALDLVGAGLTTLEEVEAHTPLQSMETSEETERE